MSTDGGLHSNASSPGEEAVGGLVSDFEAVSHRRTPLHVAFTPPVETFCARRFGVDSKGLPLAKKPDGDVSDMEWIRPGSAEDRQKIVACLIKRKADPNRVDYHDHSALHYACVWGWVPTVDLLLEEGADPECSNIGAISASRGALVPSLH